MLQWFSDFLNSLNLVKVLLYLGKTPLSLHSIHVTRFVEAPSAEKTEKYAEPWQLIRALPDKSNSASQQVWIRLITRLITFFYSTSQFCTNCEERCPHKCSFAFRNIERWHYWHFRLLKLSKKWLSVTSFSIQCALDKARFVFELIWLATVYIWSYSETPTLPTPGISKKKLTWLAAPY